MKTQAFVMPPGALCIEPQAYGAEFAQTAVVPAADVQSDVAVVQVRGPLRHRAHWWFDSYDAIRSRVGAAIEAGAKTVILDVDSSGGEAAGMVETSQAIRQMAADANVELVAYVGGTAASAGYALASAATRIVASSTARLGSIGIMVTATDSVERLKREGINAMVIASGARKGDGHPMKPLDEAAIAAIQREIDAFAGAFFELVSGHGWVGSVDDVRKLEAGVFLGADAVAQGLASEVGSLDQLIAAAAAGDEPMDDMESVLAALQGLAAGDTPEAAQARAALSAMAASEDDESSGEASEETEEEASDEGESPDAEGDNDDAESSDDEESDAEARLRLAMEVHELRARLGTGGEAGERERLLASRPDFDKELRAELGKASTPIEVVRRAVKSLSKGHTPKDRVASATKRGTTRGQKNGVGPALPASEAAALDAAFKTGKPDDKSKAVHTPTSMTFGKGGF